MERLFSLDAQLIYDAILLAIAILVMFTFLSYLLFNPARDFLKKRQERVKQDIDQAAADKEEARKSGRIMKAAFRIFRQKRMRF